MEADREYGLVRRLKNGDADAWRELCSTYGDALYSYAYYRTGRNREIAEDVRQETLIAAAKSIVDFRGQVPLFAWLCGIIRHKAADEVGSRCGKELSLESLGEESDKGVNSVLLYQYGRDPLPEEVLERDETRAVIIEALWSLPVNYREALILRYLRNEGVEEIALRIHLSYKAAESLLSRAKKALRRRLKEVERRGSYLIQG
jgi:RNA polymerase sigma-70 factor (ECF subfamily)